jgi:four helix bundle protein
MATLKNFEELDAWKEARSFTNKIYSISNQSPFSKDFALCNQIRKASISIMSNIAEGFERSGNREFIQFLSIAKESVGEVRSQLYIAQDQNYIDQTTFLQLVEQSDKVCRIIAGLISYLKNSGMKGDKFVTNSSKK